MKRTVVVSAIFILWAFISKAEGNIDRKEYAGRYVLPVESMIGEVEITIQNDTLLTISLPVGEIILEYLEEDCFEVPQYGATAVFERDEKQEVTACRISIPMADIKDLIAKKQ
ncbi:MAG: hypothetical protein LBQ73_01740 [Tannerellaceae bacterium]|jgi:hypothetical protein|nr:hypothetical protein [Tannerellaceae bacterium]